MLGEISQTQEDRPLWIRSRELSDTAGVAEVEWNGGHQGHQGGEEGAPLFNGYEVCFARKKKNFEDVSQE